MLDNFRVDVTGLGRVMLTHALGLVFQQHPSAAGWRVLLWFGGEKPWKQQEARQVGLPTFILYWHRDTTSKHPPSPFPVSVTLGQAVEVAGLWLEKQDYGPEPDHDGDNSRGFRVFCEAWGHVAGDPYAMCAVQPAWAMHGK